MKEEAEQNYKLQNLSGISEVRADSILATGSGLETKKYSLPGSKWRRIFGGTAILLIALTLGGLAAAEFKTFYFEARYLARFTRKLSFSVKPGPNPSLRFPQQGPYDKRVGYIQLPDFVKSLSAEGYQIEAQARASSGFSERMNPRGVLRMACVALRISFPSRCTLTVRRESSVTALRCRASLSRTQDGPFMSRLRRYRPDVVQSRLETYLREINEMALLTADASCIGPATERSSIAAICRICVISSSNCSG